MDNYKFYRKDNYIVLSNDSTKETFYGFVKEVLVDKSNLNKAHYRFFNIKDWNSDTPLLITQLLEEDGSPYTQIDFEEFYRQNTGNFNGGGSAPGVQSVTGVGVDNSDPLNPVITGGGSASTYNFEQLILNDTWIISHNLDTLNPIITVYDKDNKVIIPSQIVGTSNNIITISFPTPIAGYAVLTGSSFIHSIIPSNDPDADAFITSVGTLNVTNQNAIKQLVSDLKGYGIWSKLLSINPKAGATATEHKWNLKDPRDLDIAYRQTYTGGWVHNTLGAKSNSTDTFADTKLNMSTLNLIGDLSMGVYVTETPTNSGDAYFMGGHSGTNNFVAIQRGNTTSISGVGYAPSGNALVVPSETKGFMAISILGINRTTYHETTVLEVATANGFSVPNVNIYEGALNLTGRYGSLGYTAGTSFIGKGLNNTEIFNLRTCILTYETTLGRN